MLERVLIQTLGGLGYELADFEYSNRNKVLQVFIEKGHQVKSPAGGIGLEDCQRVSEQLQRVLPVEGIEYERLEVSSPGLDRRLRKVKDFVRFEGHEAEVRLRVPVQGRRRLVGTLGAVVDEELAMEVEGKRYVFDITNIERARLVPQI